MRMRAVFLASVAGAVSLAAPARADTLRDALAGAYRTNPILQAARADQRATDENVPIQRAAGLPGITADAQFVEFLIQDATRFTAPDRVITAGPDLTVPVYSGGAVKNAVRAAKERVQAGQANLRATESSLFSQVVATYMDVIRNEALVALSANQVDVLAINLQATQDRFEIGDLTRTDIAQSQSRLALARTDLQSAQANLIGARETYIQLVGDAPVDLAPPPPLPGLPDDVNDAVDIALDANPDLIAARENAAAAGYDIDVAGSGRLPRVSVFAGYDYQNFFGTLGGSFTNPNDPDGPPLLAPQTTTAAQAGVSLSVPIFQGGRVAAQQRQATARASAALERVIAAERDVIAQVRASYSSYYAARSIIESSQAAVAAAELGLEGVRAENSIGNRTILDVLNAEQELLNTRTQLVTARRNAYVAGFSLLAAMGRAEARDLGFEDDGLLYDPTLNYDRVRNRVWDWDRDPRPAVTSTRTIDIPAAGADIPATETRRDR